MTQRKVLGETTWGNAFFSSLFSKRDNVVETPPDGEYVLVIKHEGELVHIKLCEPAPETS